MLMLFITRSSISIATLPALTMGSAAQDAWAASLVIALGSVLIVLLIAGLGIQFEDKSVVRFSQELLGKPFGTAITTGFLIVLLHFVGAEARLYAELIIGSFVPDTPIPFIVGSMVILAAIACYLGVETIGRTSDVLVPLFTLAILIALPMGFSAFDSRSLEPVLARGLKPVLSSTATSLALGGKYLSLGVLIPQATKPTRILLPAVATTLLAGITQTLIAVMVVGVLGPDLGNSSVFPFLSALRAVNIIRLIQRVEALGTIAWGFAILVDTSVLLYVLCRATSELMDLQDYRPLVGPIATVWFVYSMQSYDNLLSLLHFHESPAFAVFVTVTVFVPYALLWIAYGIRTLKVFEKRRR